MLECYRINAMGQVFVVQQLLKQNLLQSGALIANLTSLVRRPPGRSRLHDTFWSQSMQLPCICAAQPSAQACACSCFTGTRSAQWS
jgi:hypothetical protein